MEDFTTYSREKIFLQPREYISSSAQVGGKPVMRKPVALPATPSPGVHKEGAIGIMPKEFIIDAQQL